MILLMKEMVSNLIPDFGVSRAILDIFRRWCKLNFGSSQSHVKSYHFFDGQEITWVRFWILIWVYYYLLNGIRLA